MNIVFSCFQEIRNNKPMGMNKILLPIAREMSKNSKVVYYNANLASSEAGVRLEPVSIFFRKIRNLISVIVPKLFFVTNKVGTSRFLQELMYDFLLSLKINSPVLLVSSAYTKHAFIKNSKIGGVNIFISGNPDDREIYKILQSEMLKYRVEIKDAYTHSRRVSFINSTLDEVRFLVLITQSQFESYSKNIASDKIIFKENYVQPETTLFPEVRVKKEYKFTVCYIAHTVWLKGLVQLIEGWSQTSLENSQLLIGGTVSKEVMKFIDENFPNMNNVIFLGKVSDLNDFYRRSHVCIVPSLLDAGPATIAESLFCGTPVICTDGCGSKTLINENNGIVIKSGSVDAIASAIECVYKKCQLNGFDSEEVKSALGGGQDGFEKDIAALFLKHAS